MTFSARTKIPDFFIVGAPKCGTSFMHYYLRQHPEVYLPETKELYYFGKDLTYQIPRLSKEKYLDYFAAARADQIAGDATATYLRSESAAREIEEFNPEAKIIIMIRNPVKLIYSLYSEMRFNGNEPAATFEEALELVEERRENRQVPQKVTCPVENFDYYSMGLLSEQIRRYQNIFQPDQIHLILYDDLKMNPAKTYASVLDFLEVDPNFQPDFTYINPNKETRSSALQKFLNFLPEWMKKGSRVLFPSKSLRKKTFEKLQQWNTTFKERPEMSKATWQHLTEYFQPEIKRLSELMNRDLSHWYTKQ